MHINSLALILTTFSCRPLGQTLVDGNSGYLWLDYRTGEKVQNKRVSRHINAAWKKGGQVRYLSTNYLRKAIVTQVSIILSIYMDGEGVRPTGYGRGGIEFLVWS